MVLDQAAEQFQTKRYTKADLLAELTPRAITDNPLDSIEEHGNEPTVTFIMNAIRDAEVVGKVAEKMFAKGYALPRYECLEKKCERRLYVFEKIAKQTAQAA